MYWDQNDLNAITTTLSSGMNWAVGSEVTHFEHDLSENIGTKYCLTFNSGTSALHASLLAYEVGKSDEVIVPSFTFIATANAPLFVGAKPVFADIEEKTLGLSPESVLEHITPKTKAIIPVHYGGCPCMIHELREIADDHNLILIEDAAESFGAKIKGVKVGTFGDSAMLSFCQNKIITTGEGGAIVTDSRKLYEKMKLIRSHGRLETSDYFSSQEPMDYITLGYNFRLSNIAASLGLTQLQKVDTMIQMRKKIAEKYVTLLKKYAPKASPMLSPYGYDHVYQLFSVRLLDRNRLMEFLTSKGIMSKIYFPPVHLTHYYKKKLGYEISLPITETVAENIVSLPIYPGMSDEDLRTVVEAVGEFYQENQ
ncbi:DegT/DnrJ/EryC1/StrS family aminotransferase [Methanospirillum lacunae]|nr:DegT/DnrJ/EryC1/StrS family aminotransferase [Methanospirillum lacunae]